MSRGLASRFLLVWFGQVVSTLGTMVSGFGAAVWVFEETGSYVWLGMLTAAVMFMPVVASPFLGVVDRFDRRWLMIVADSVAAVCVSAALIVWLFGELRPWHLVVVGVAASFAAAFQYPAYSAAVPDLVERDELDRANGLIQFGPAISIVAGPAIAGLLLAGLGIGAILVFDLLSFLVGVGTVAAARFVSRPSPAGGDDRRMATAVRWVWHSARPFALLIGAMAVVNLALGLFNVTLLGIATELGGTARAGWPATAGGVGMIAASAVLSRRGLPRRRVPVIAFGVGLFGVFTLVAVARPWLWLFIVGVGVAFIGIPIVQTAGTTLFHEGIPPAMQGRVFGLRAAVGQGTSPIGAVIAGPLAAWSAAGTMAAAGMLLAVMAVVIAWSPTLRTLDHDPTVTPHRGAGDHPLTSADAARRGR